MRWLNDFARSNREAHSDYNYLLVDSASIICELIYIYLIKYQIILLL